MAASAMIDLHCYGVHGGTIVRLFGDGRMSVQLDDGRIEFADYAACGPDDELTEGQEVVCADVAINGRRKLLVSAFVEE